MEKLINAKIKELTENGKLDEIVTKEATKFIQSILNDVLSSYSDLGKAFKSKVNSSLTANLENIDFVQYSKTLIDIVESELNKTMIEIGIAPAKQMIQSFVGDLEKKEWKLSEIIQRFKEEEVIPDDRNESGEIAFIYEVSEYGTIYVSFHEDNKKSRERYNCKYRLMIDKKTKKLYSPSVDGMPTHPIKEMGGLYGFDLFLFKLYAMGCIIECDPNNIEAEWSTYND